MAGNDLNGLSLPTKQMRGVVWEGKPFEVAVKDLPFPMIKAPEDAIVRITSSTICGSDLHTYHGILGSRQVPFALGHEAVGIVISTGSAVDFFKPGDRVVILDFVEDGRIDTDPQLVPQLQTFGFGLDFGNDQGLQAEYVRVPFADSTLIKIPRKLEDKEYIVLSDIWPTGWQGLTWSGFQAGEAVAVFGAGPVGLLCAYSAILRGASIVYAIDHVPARLEKAAEIGAIPINFTVGGGASEQILALRPSGVERSVDCVGLECLNAKLQPQEDYIINEAVKITRQNGGIGVVGIYLAQPKSDGVPNGDNIKPSIDFPISDFWIKNLTIQGGSVNGRPVIPRLLELIKSGRGRPGFIFTAESNLEQAPEAYSTFDKQLEVKVLLNVN